MTRLARLCPCAFLLAVGASSLALPRSASAQPRPSTPAAGTGAETAANQAKAQEHFRRAKDLYGSGNYREALTELEAARKLDPNAKELVFNVGIVHEKLGHYDEAIAAFQGYVTMETVTAQERAKAESIITRIEGAKRTAAAEAPKTEETHPSAPPPVPAESAQPHAEPRRGRMDGLTMAAAGVAAAGVAVGTIFGVRALAIRPDGFVAGRDGTYETLQARTDEAHTSAIVADVGFAVGALAALAAAYVYFGRTKEPSPTTKTARGPLGAGGVSAFGLVVVGGFMP